MIDDAADLTGRPGAQLLTFVDHTGTAAAKARGATSKIDAVDEAVELVRIVDTPIGRGRVGEIAVMSRKSRNGMFPAGETMARVVFDSTAPMPAPLRHLGTSMVVSITLPADVEAAAAARAEQERLVLDAIATMVLEHKLPLDAEIALARVWERVDIHRDRLAAVRGRLVARGRITARQTGSARNAPWVVALVADPGGAP